MNKDLCEFYQEFTDFVYSASSYCWSSKLGTPAAYHLFNYGLKSLYIMYNFLFEEDVRKSDPDEKTVVCSVAQLAE